MYHDLKGKVAWITGSGGNLGRAVARRLYDEQVKLVLTDHTEVALQSTLTVLKGESDSILSVCSDAGDPEAVRSLLEKTVQTFGRLDILVHTVGGFSMGSVDTLQTSELDYLFQLNVRSAFVASAGAARAMKATATTGRIINIGARSALEGTAGLAAYSASKAALLRLTESLALELQKDRITVNAVLPSTLDTPANRATMPETDPSSWVTLSSLAGVIAFLTSEEARDISGAAIPVYGRS